MIVLHARLHACQMEAVLGLTQDATRHFTEQTIVALLILLALKLVRHVVLQTAQAKIAARVTAAAAHAEIIVIQDAQTIMPAANAEMLHVVYQTAQANHAVMMIAVAHVEHVHLGSHVWVGYASKIVTHVILIATMDAIIGEGGHTHVVLKVIG